MRLEVLRSPAWILIGLLACTKDGPPQKKGPPPACVCEASEDCRACYEHIGECCYGDATVLGMVGALADNCQRDGTCSSCCNECVKKTCEELVKGNDCPLPPAKE